MLVFAEAHAKSSSLQLSGYVLQWHWQLSLQHLLSDVGFGFHLGLCTSREFTAEHPGLCLHAEEESMPPPVRLLDPNTRRLLTLIWMHAASDGPDQPKTYEHIAATYGGVCLCHVSLRTVHDPMNDELTDRA